MSRSVDVEAVILTLASIVRTDNGNLHPEINALLADAEEAAAAVVALIDASGDGRQMKTDDGRISLYFSANLAERLRNARANTMGPAI